MSEREGLDWDMDGETGNQVRAYLSRISSFTKDEASQALAYVRHLESEYNGAIADCGTAEDNAKAALNRAATAKAQVAQGEMREREILADVKILIEGHPLAERTQGARVRLLVWLRDRPSETSTPQEPRRAESDQPGTRERDDWRMRLDVSTPQEPRPQPATREQDDWRLRLGVSTPQEGDE